MLKQHPAACCDGRMTCKEDFHCTSFELSDPTPSHLTSAARPASVSPYTPRSTRANQP